MVRTARPLLLFSFLLLDFACGSWIYETLNVTQWQWQSSAVVGDWIYIDGGELYANEDGTPKFFYLGQTISIDLSTSWTNTTIQKYSFDTQRPVTDGHWSKKPALFQDTTQNTIVQWGGWPYDNGDLSYVFSFTLNDKGTVNWVKDTTPITNQVDQTSPAIFGSAFTASNSTFYSLGGVVAEASSDPYTGIQGLIEYDFASNKWTNTSSIGATASGYLLGAEAEFTSAFGEAGFLVFIGGSDPSTQEFDPDSAPLRDMANITLYDIANKTWYHQIATGSIPPPRKFFCSVGVNSIQDTFEVFVLGGSTNSTFDAQHQNDDDYLNVYALSLPAFTWFKSTASDAVRRADHSCQLIGNRQMLVIGGNQPGNAQGIAAADPWPHGVGIFDTTAFDWADRYDPSADLYTQPSIVQNYYNYYYQVPQWNSPALAPIFAWSPPDSSSGPTPSITPVSTSAAVSPSAFSAPSSTVPIPTPTPSQAPNPHHTSIGAIVGGVLGGLAVIALLVFLGFCFGRRKPKSRNEVPYSAVNTAEPLSPEFKHELDSPDPQQRKSWFSSTTATDNNNRHSAKSPTAGISEVDGTPVSSPGMVTTPSLPELPGEDVRRQRSNPQSISTGLLESSGSRGH